MRDKDKTEGLRSQSVILNESTSAVPDVEVSSKIRVVNDVQVMLDRDLAALYGVETKHLNRAVKRNIDRFPPDFMFQLTKEDCIRCQIVTLKENGEKGGNWLRYLPYAFTENGIAMLSSVLRSPIAIDVNIRIMRAFVAMRKTLSSLAPILARVEANERRQIADQAKNDANQVRNEERFKLILDAMRDKKFPPQKVFFDGQFFDAFEQIKKFVKMAKRELIVIDPYFDDSGLDLIAQKRDSVQVLVVHCPRARLHAVDVQRFNQQYANSLATKVTDKFHDRYLIIDGATLIHVGASLNYLGKKCFAFSTLESANIPDIVARIP